MRRRLRHHSTMVCGCLPLIRKLGSSATAYRCHATTQQTLAEAMELLPPHVRDSAYYGCTEDMKHVDPFHLVTQGKELCARVMQLISATVELPSTGSYSDVKGQWLTDSNHPADRTATPPEINALLDQILSTARREVARFQMFHDRGRWCNEEQRMVEYRHHGHEFALLIRYLALCIAKIRTLSELAHDALRSVNLEVVAVVKLMLIENGQGNDASPERETLEEPRQEDDRKWRKRVSVLCKETRELLETVAFSVGADGVEALLQGTRLGYDLGLLGRREMLTIHEVLEMYYGVVCDVCHNQVQYAGLGHRVHWAVNTLQRGRSHTYLSLSALHHLVHMRERFPLFICSKQLALRLLRGLVSSLLRGSDYPPPPHLRQISEENGVKYEEESLDFIRRIVDEEIASKQAKGLPIPTVLINHARRRIGPAAVGEGKQLRFSKRSASVPMHVEELAEQLLIKGGTHWTGAPFDQVGCLATSMCSLALGHCLLSMHGYDEWKEGCETFAITAFLFMARWNGNVQLKRPKPTHEWAHYLECILSRAIELLPIGKRAALLRDPRVLHTMMQYCEVSVAATSPVSLYELLQRTTNPRINLSSALLGVQIDGEDEGTSRGEIDTNPVVSFIPNPPESSLWRFPYPSVTGCPLHRADIIVTYASLHLEGFRQYFFVAIAATWVGLHRELLFPTSDAFRDPLLRAQVLEKHFSSRQSALHWFYGLRVVCYSLNASDLAGPLFEDLAELVQQARRKGVDSIATEDGTEWRSSISVAAFLSSHMVIQHRSPTKFRLLLRAISIYQRARRRHSALRYLLRITEEVVAPVLLEIFRSFENDNVQKLLSVLAYLLHFATPLMRLRSLLQSILQAAQQPLPESSIPRVTVPVDDLADLASATTLNPNHQVIAQKRLASFGLGSIYQRPCGMPVTTKLLVQLEALCTQHPTLYYQMCSHHWHPYFRKHVIYVGNTPKEEDSDEFVADDGNEDVDDDKNCLDDGEFDDLPIN